MNTSVNEKINEIRIPETLEKRISMGFDQGKLEEGIRRNRMKKRLTSAAASAAVILVVSGVIGFDEVGAAIKNALRYVPGFNVLISRDDGELLVLPEEVEVRDGELFMRLKAAVQSDGIISLAIESNLGVTETVSGKEKEDESFQDEFNRLNLSLKSPDGKSYSKKGWSLGSGGEYWLHSADFEITEGTTDYVLTAGELTLGFKLSASEGVDTLADLGPSATDKEIMVAGLRSETEDEVRISLVNSSKNGIISSYPLGEETHYALFGSPFPLESLYIEDSQGMKTYPEIPSSYGGLLSNFVFKADPLSDYRLVLPYMEMSYPDIRSEKITLQTPEDGETIALNKSLQLGRFTVDVLEISRQGDEVSLKLASDPAEDEILAGFTVEGVGGYGMSYEEEPVLLLSYSNIGNRFTMRLKNPHSLLEGKWMIDLPKKN